MTAGSSTASPRTSWRGEGDDENPAKWYWFEGNFQAYQENRVARLGEDAARPHRLHKKLTRV